jgi:hypothetical protein
MIVRWKWTRPHAASAASRICRSTTATHYEKGLAREGARPRVIGILERRKFCDQYTSEIHGVRVRRPDELHGVFRSFGSA